MGFKAVIEKILTWLAKVASWIFSIPTLISPFYTISSFILEMFLPLGAVEIFYIFILSSTSGVHPFGWTPWLIYYIPWTSLMVAPETRWLVLTRIEIEGEPWGTFIIVARPLFFMFGLTLLSVALYQFIKAKRKRVKLVKEGLYSIVRHPQYLGIIISTFGFVLYGLRPADFLAWFILSFLYIFLALREEKKLLKALGEEYKSYKDSVPFILPKIRRPS